MEVGLSDKSLGKMADIMRRFPAESASCACGSGLAYANCCRPYHAGEAWPQTAEALMRSRFTAYALRDADYLLASWAADKRPTRIDFSGDASDWHKLVIRTVKKGTADDSKGLVEFKAFYTLQDEQYYLHEISRFGRQDGCWVYLDGEIKAAGKLLAESNDRNALCTCGSGRKFKHCCGR